MSAPISPQKIARRISRRLAQLEAAAEAFAVGEFYSESEVNEELKLHFEDHVFGRRLLISWSFLDRTPDGLKYWRLKVES